MEAGVRSTLAVKIFGDDLTVLKAKAEEVERILKTVEGNTDVNVEIITGQPPFVGDSPVAVAYQHVRKDPEPPSQLRDGISPELDAVVLKRVLPPRSS